MQRCVIVGNAEILDYNRTKEYINSDDLVICCDGGLRHMEQLNTCPSMIVGDFDSHVQPKTEIETIVLPREKDDTDSFFAVKEAFRRGYREFLLLGLFGGRIDHSLGNISLMLWLYKRGCQCVALDDYSEMQIVGKEPVSIEGSYPFFSLLCVDGPASGITITGAKFPLNNGKITPEYQYGISNEVLADETAVVSVLTGVLLLVRMLTS